MITLRNFLYEDYFLIKAYISDFNINYMFIREFSYKNKDFFEKYKQKIILFSMYWLIKYKFILYLELAL